MTLHDINENDKTIERLSIAAGRGNISHAYIFEGDAGVDKTLIANCFAKAILCQTNKGKGCATCIACRKIEHGNHEDIIYVETDGSSIKDEAIEELQERLKKKPYAGDRNIAIIKDADSMTLRAQNRLLKTLEEPHSGTVIMLLSENVENLTKTILSRCISLRFNPFQTPEYETVLQEAELLLQMIFDGEPFYKTKARTLALAEDRDRAYQLLDAMETVCGDLARGRRECSKSGRWESLFGAVECIEEARRDLLRGMNVGYTLKNMILKMEEWRW